MENSSSSLNAHMRLYDNLLTNGYYTTRLMIGTPPQEFSLIVDTGSTVTYVPCSSCEQCGNHQVLNGRGYHKATADLWSCGVILFVLLARFLPFDVNNNVNQYKKIYSDRRLIFGGPGIVTGDNFGLVASLSPNHDKRSGRMK